MNPAFISTLVFVAAALAVLGGASLVFDLFFRHREAVQTRLRDEFQKDDSVDSGRTTLFKDLKQLASEARLSQPTWRKRFAEMVEQSGLGISPSRLAFGTLVTAWITGVASVLLGRQVWFGVAGSAAGLAVPIMWVHYCRKRRIEALRAQLPDAFDLMSQTLRAGQTVTSAFQTVAENFDGLLAREFTYCFEQHNLGLPLPVAVTDLARRTGVLELRMFAVTLSLQRQSGGNPIGVLTNLAEVIRKRIKLAGRVKALTGEGRMQALVLLVLPLLLFVALYFFHADYVTTLLDHPSLLLAMVASQVCGALWIRQIVNFEY
jgi:tight adherence protein B